MDKKNIGVYYCLFQSQIHKSYVQVWVDGEEYASYIQKEELLNLVREANFKLLPDFKKALRETSYFFWDVAGDVLKRVHAQYELEPYKEMIKRQEKEEHEELPITERFFKKSFDSIEKDPRITVADPN